ncbi:polysaccharide deacetylase family protein [Methylobacterium bullatum]|uniref:polysaccharide deacetylase family protein n=1 Tax=Methylobacterium bullatum TaxID=570505 RepID=UPI001F9E3CCC|nr:polysaccharide deacetylase [Methylobacterium bullatum]
MPFVRRLLNALYLGATILASAIPSAHSAAAQKCGLDALGTSRVLPVSITDGPVGRVGYGRTLQLAPGEVVLTFDDGPLPRRTPAILDALREACVRATFFVVGTMAAEYPHLLRQTAADGHTIATHTWSHRLLNRVRNEAARRDQISGGLAAVRSVLGDEHAAFAPFFRYPGLGRTPVLDAYLAARGLVPFGIDVESDDWRRITPAEVVERVMRRLATHGRGIVLLHDIQSKTAAMLPTLLHRLKTEGYRIVHVVPAPGETRLALRANDVPQDRRMLLALNRLDARMGTVRLAEAGVGPTPVEKPLNVATALQTPPVQIASLNTEAWALRLIDSKSEILQASELAPADRPTTQPSAIAPPSAQAFTPPRQSAAVSAETAEAVSIKTAPPRAANSPALAESMYKGANNLPIITVSDRASITVRNGFVVLAVAPGTKTGFTEITVNR